MPDLDLLFSFILMGLLFIRQVVIFKLPNKINYAPLLLGIGAIGAMMHLLLHPEQEDFFLLVRESVLPFLVGLMLFIIMNIMRQTQDQQSMVDLRDFTESLMDQMTQLREYFSLLEKDQDHLHKQEDSMQHDMSRVFEKEIEALHTIQKNQHDLIERLGEMMRHQETAFKEFEVFSKQEMPDIDNVIHRHIDMLRIAEKDHFNQIKGLLVNVDQKSLIEKLDSFRIDVDHLLMNNKEAAKEMVAQAGRETRTMLSDLSRQLTALRSQAEGMTTALSEDEVMFASLREQSQLVMRQMVLSAEQINGIATESERIREIYEPLQAVSGEVAGIKEEYDNARLQLEQLAQMLSSVESDRLEQMQRYIETLGEHLEGKVDESMKSLQEHYHIAERDISQSVKELSAKNKLHASYQGDQNS